MGLLGILRKKSKALILVATLSSSLSACQASIQEVKKPELTRELFRLSIRLNIALENMIEVLDKNVRKNIKRVEELKNEGKSKEAYILLWKPIKTILKAQQDLDSLSKDIVELVGAIKGKPGVDREDIEDLKEATIKIKGAQQIIDELLKEIERIQEEMREELKRSRQIKA